MIGFVDAFTLAMTKLKTRKTRIVVTAAIASLLFALLVMASTVIQGGLESYARYSSNGLSTRFLTKVDYYGLAGTDLNSAELIVKAKERNKAIIEQKKADAKRLGIEYDIAKEQPVVMAVDGTKGQEFLNTSNIAARQVIAEADTQKATPLDTMKKLAAPYRPKAFYQGKLLGDTTNLQVMEKGREEFDPNKNAHKNYGMAINDVTSLGYLPQTIIGPYLLDDVDITPVTDENSALPVVAPYKIVEKALGFSPLPKTATNNERLMRIEDVKKKAGGVTIELCYRNNSSRELLEQTRQQIAEIDAHKHDKHYTQPDIVYALPHDTDCGAVTIAKDTRGADARRYADKLHEFDIKYENVIDPVQKKITLKVIGLSPDSPDYTTMGTLDSLAMMIGSSTLQGLWVVPEELVDFSVREKIIPPASSDNPGHFMGSGAMNIIEFDTPYDTKRFVTEQGCSGMDCGTKPIITYFGSNSVLLDDIKENVTKALLIAALVVSLIAAIIMMGMIGRVITDSRRETAVFRAIGAKRADIRLIYTIYVLSFSLIVALFATGIGFLAASLISINQQENLTASARLMFIESREVAPFVLAALWPAALAVTVGIVVLAGLTAMLLPLSRNLTRSPLRDMRDE